VVLLSTGITISDGLTSWNTASCTKISGGLFSCIWVSPVEDQQLALKMEMDAATASTAGSSSAQKFTNASLIDDAMLGNDVRTLKVIEWFSGIGGWSFALQLVEQAHPEVKLEVIQAIDINTLSNEVYYHNLHLKPVSKSIESVTQKFLAANPADIWVMSPPCQPFTRNHEKTTDDHRTQALDHITELIRTIAASASDTTMPILPAYIALENVVGFEDSANCAAFLSVISEAGYKFQQFILSPTQFGIPNERPRYFLTARRCSSTSLGTEYASSVSKALPNLRPSVTRRLGDYLLYEMRDSELVRDSY
jgi:site-specific DNA-cytosine methylase